MPVATADRLLRVRTDKDVHFTAAIAQNAGLHVTLTAQYIGAQLRCVLGADGFLPALLPRMRARVRAIRILSKENLAWEVWFFANRLFATTNADTETFLGRWSFLATDGIRATVAAVLDTHYHYYASGLDIPLEDTDQMGQLYLRLVNRSASGKSADSDGELVVELLLEPAQGV